jgi:hypothetical protein
MASITERFMHQANSIRSSIASTRRQRAGWLIAGLLLILGSVALFFMPLIKEAFYVIGALLALGVLAIMLGSKRIGRLLGTA